MKHIYFYGYKWGRVDEEYEFLSNFHEDPFVLDGNEYATVEHYYQSKKFEGTEYEEKVRLAPTPKDAKRLARAKKIREDWYEINKTVMLRALRAKFEQNPDLAKKLLETGDAQLHEESPKDMYWGVKGQDRLGKLLMQVREELRKKNNMKFGNNLDRLFCNCTEMPCKPLTGAIKSGKERSL